MGACFGALSPERKGNTLSYKGLASRFGGSVNN